MKPASELSYGPRRFPIWCAWIGGGGACLFGVAMLALAILNAHQDAFLLYFFGLMGVSASAFGLWMVVHGFWMTKLRAIVTPGALHLVAHRGRHLILESGLAEAAIPWAEIQGFSSMRILNISAETRTQTTYILYTNRGDFTLNDIQWDNLAGLVREVSARTGRNPGEVAPERSVARKEVETGKRRVFGLQRTFGWITLGLSLPLLLLVILGGFIDGFSANLVSGGFMLTVAIGLGSTMIRFYRR